MKKKIIYLILTLFVAIIGAVSATQSVYLVKEMWQQEKPNPLTIISFIGFAVLTFVSIGFAFFFIVKSIVASDGGKK